MRHLIFVVHVTCNYTWFPTDTYIPTSRNSLAGVQSITMSPVTAVPTQFSIPEVSVEDVQPAGSTTSLKVGWTEKDGNKQPATQEALAVPVTSPSLKKVAKQLIEKHTIENVNLENRLRDKETDALKKLHTKVEARKAKLIAESKNKLKTVLSHVESKDKEGVIVDNVKDLQENLAMLEEEKDKMIEATLETLVEERAMEKKKLVE